MRAETRPLELCPSLRPAKARQLQVPLGSCDSLYLKRVQTAVSETKSILIPSTKELPLVGYYQVLVYISLSTQLPPHHLLVILSTLKRLIKIT